MWSKHVMFLKRHEPWLLNTCFGRAKKVSKRRRAFLNCKKLWQQSNEKFVEKTCTRKSSSEKRATAFIFGPVPNSSSLCWSLTFWKTRGWHYIIWERKTIWLQILLAVSDKGCSSLLFCWPGLENNTDRGSEWRRRTWELKELIRSIGPYPN